MSAETQTLRTWGQGKRCSECCWGDRCDDPTHYYRDNCPHCKGTGWALWTEAGRKDYADHLQTSQGMSEEDAQAVITKATTSQGEGTS